MNNSQRSTFAILVSVFFFWGFVAASNDILIPVFKDAFGLQNWQSQMINFAFYGAYFVGSVFYALLAGLGKFNIIEKFGFQRSISIGLTVSALGTLLFIPAATFNSFLLMITGLFVVGLGFSLQQTAANPFAISLGDPSKGSQRLSLAGGINNLGTTVAPMLVSLAIFGSLKADSEVARSVSDVQTPYLLLGLAFILAATVFFITGKKEYRELKLSTNKPSAIDDKTSTQVKEVNIFSYKQLVLGMVAIFFYVGVEVATAGNLGEYMKRELGFTNNAIGPYVALFWGSLMIGRWANASAAFTSNNLLRITLKILLPFVAFGIFLGVTHLFGNDISPFYNYFFIIPILIIADFASLEKPHFQLAIFSTLGIVSLLIGIYANGIYAVYGLMSVGLFCSTLWPCIFTLAISGLGKQASKGSSFLIMMILGGAVISVLQGVLADVSFIGISNSFYLGVICFIYLFIYALIAGPIHTRNLADAKEM
ncbi:MAG: MFS transporter [Lishizhenia sp.]